MEISSSFQQHTEIISSNGTILNSPELNMCQPKEEQEKQERPSGSNNEFESFLQTLLFEKLDDLKSMQQHETGGLSVNPMELMCNNGQVRKQQQFLTRRRYNSVVPILSTVGRSQLQQQSPSIQKPRNSHLESEKRRRVCMKDCYDKLSALLPEDGQRTRMSKANILNAACDYLDVLKEKCAQIEAENSTVMKRRQSV
jgi:hypothetical protein